MDRLRKQYLLRLLVRCFFGKKILTVKGEAGLPFRFPPSEYPSLLLGLSHIDPETRRQWALLLQNNDTILDVGANIGFTLHRFFAITQGHCYLHAFEPIPRNFKLLQVNAAALKPGGVRLHNCAIGNSNGTVKFVDNLAQGALSHIMPSAQPKGQRKGFFWRECSYVDVTMKTIDTLLGECIDLIPGFVKIDVEGAGAMVLEGARSMFRRCKPVVHCEFHSAPERDKVIHILRREGYLGIRFGPHDSVRLCGPEKAIGLFIHPSDRRLGRIGDQPFDI